MNSPQPDVMDKISKILNDFRQQSLIIDANNSLGSGENGAKAFRLSLDAATERIYQLLSDEKDRLLEELYNLREAAIFESNNHVMSAQWGVNVKHIQALKSNNKEGDK